MTEHPNLSGAIVASSALRREQYVRLSRLLFWRECRSSLLRLVVLTALIEVLLILIDIVSESPLLGLSPRGLAVILVAIIGAVVAVVWATAWWLPYRMWAGQAKLLTAPGTVTVDSTGVMHNVPGVVDSHVSWSSIESAVYSGDMLGLRLTRYAYIMFALPEDPQAAARLRELVTKQVHVG